MSETVGRARQEAVSEFRFLTDAARMANRGPGILGTLNRLDRKTNRRLTEMADFADISSGMLGIFGRNPRTEAPRFRCRL